MKKNGQTFAGKALTRAKGLLRAVISSDTRLHDKARLVAIYLLDNCLNSQTLTAYPGNASVA